MVFSLAVTLLKVFEASHLKLGSPKAAALQLTEGKRS